MKNFENIYIYIYMTERRRTKMINGEIVPLRENMVDGDE